MKPALMAIAAMCIYGAHSVILEQRLSKISVIVLMMIMYSVPPVLSTLVWWVRSANGDPLHYPSNPSLWLWAFGAGVILFCANFMLTGAFTNGGSVFTITIISVLLPVAASLIRYVWVGGLPTGRQMVGYTLAAIAVYLVVTGRAKIIST